MKFLIGVAFAVAFILFVKSIYNAGKLSKKSKKK